MSQREYKPGDLVYYIRDREDGRPLVRVGIVSRLEDGNRGPRVWASWGKEESHGWNPTHICKPANFLNTRAGKALRKTGKVDL